MFTVFDEKKASAPFFVAELSGNHGGSLDTFLKSIEAAKKCGADAVKIQTYTPESLTIACSRKDFTLDAGLWAGRQLYDLYNEARTPLEWHKALFEYATELDIPIFSSPFCFRDVDFLEDLNCPVYKIASFELVDIPLIKYVAETKKPMIMSTGVSTDCEIIEAVDCAKAHGAGEIIVLHCVSDYPSELKNAELSRIQHLRSLTGLRVGLSDHSPGSIAPLIARVLGAELIEKHFCIDKSVGGPDVDFSMVPSEFEEMVCNVKLVDQSLRTSRFSNSSAEPSNRYLQRSLYIVADVKRGERLTKDNVRSIRPGHGLSPKYLELVLGKKVTCDVERGTPLTFDHIFQN